MQKPRKSRSTTNSNHRYHKWKNLIKGFIPTAANQLWVSDITYVELKGGCCYLHLVTDAYSKKIVGWYLAESLASVFTLRALRMAIGQAGGSDLSGLIHHSDRGVQYCCDLYVEVLLKHNISISMTEDYKPTDNGRRPHMSIGNQTPDVAHGQTGEQKKMWKNKIYRKNEQGLQINP